MRILTLGDVTDPRAVDYLAAHLWHFRKERRIDFTVLNAENAGFIVGPSPEEALRLLDAGADVLTGGNHTLQKKSLHALLDSDARLLRPANYPAEVPGVGYTILPANGYRMLVMNAMGRVEMEPIDCPFHAIDRILTREEGNYDFSILDFHAEASGEKVGMGRYLDGRVSIVFGTHTHVPTADEQILPHGTGYITDVGMCGIREGVLGIATETILQRFLTRMPERHQPADGEVRAQGAIFTLDEGSGRVTAVERVTF